MSAPSRNSSISSSDSGNNNSSRPSPVVNSQGNTTSSTSSNQQAHFPAATHATVSFGVYQTPPRHFNFTNSSIPPTQRVPGIPESVANVLRDAEAALRRSATVNNMMREVGMTPNAIEPPAVESAERSTLRRPSLSGGGLRWATGEVQEYDTEYDRAMQAARNARDANNPAVTLAARDEVDAAMRHHEAAMALVQMATGVPVVQPHQTLAPVAESDEIVSEEAEPEEEESEEVSDSDEDASVPDARYANQIDNSGTIVTLHRPADQYLWTEADLATLRRDREEAENVRDMQSALNGVNMSGNDEIPPEMHDWAPEDHEVVAARQAEEWRAEQEDTEMSYEDSLCDICRRPDPNVWHPSMGCDPPTPPPMIESDSSDNDSMHSPMPQPTHPNGPPFEIGGSEDLEDYEMVDHDTEEESDDDPVIDPMAQINAEDDFYWALQAQDPTGADVEDYTAVFEATLDRAAQIVMANPQRTDEVATALLSEWENLSRQQTEADAREFTLDLQSFIRHRLRTRLGFATLGNTLLAILRDLAQESGMEPTGGLWALGRDHGQ
ncbi:hypothetical protein B0A54_06135 [Friedmanniomyces endolithicus]|uniref:Uncharacterized protein n=1 Tax=Friedmanniomyces endolithicus TaxID=329885 RepID=A0A4U0V5Q8_9PEZI|nr:hypothetical protein B0A54_06135 [Friedmanniomyces endolithicus]